jgi:hypothetical protein
MMEDYPDDIDKKLAGVTLIKDKDTLAYRIKKSLSSVFRKKGTSDHQVMSIRPNDARIKIEQPQVSVEAKPSNVYDFQTKKPLEQPTDPSSLPPIPDNNPPRAS